MKLFELKRVIRPLLESLKFEDLRSRAKKHLLNFLDPAWLSQFDMEENLLGAGGNGSVYKIPGEKELVVKIHNPRWGEHQHQNYDDLEENFGQPLAGEGKFSILLFQKGEPAGMTNTEKIYKSDSAISRYFSRISLAAQIPQSGYNTLIRGLIYLNNKGWSVDPSKSNNILIDKENQKFSIVDVNKTEQRGYENSGGDIIIMLCGNTFAYNAQEKCNDQDVIEKSILDRQEIIKKVIRACREEDLLVSRYDRDSSLEYSMDLADLPKDFYKSK